MTDKPGRRRGEIFNLLTSNNSQSKQRQNPILKQRSNQYNNQHESTANEDGVEVFLEHTTPMGNGIMINENLEADIQRREKVF